MNVLIVGRGGLPDATWRESLVETWGLSGLGCDTVHGLR
ncbi:hypothetical protein PA08_0402 [Cutibacterium modestum P08]|nr:hypothetical protein PA08_0402 [Cutibacterium modestum P08]